METDDKVYPYNLACLWVVASIAECTDIQKLDGFTEEESAVLRKQHKDGVEYLKAIVHKAAKLL